MHFSTAEAQRLIARMGNNLATGIVGQRELVEGLLTALIAGGHALIEGVPGLAKTRSVNLLAAACQASSEGRAEAPPRAETESRLLYMTADPRFDYFDF